MARIPMGNFGQVMQAPAPTQGMAPGGQDFVGRAVEQLGQAGEQVINRQLFEQRRAEEQVAAEAKQKADAMARATAAADQLDYGLQVKTHLMDLQGRIQRGEVPWQDADTAYTEAVNKIPPPTPGNLLAPDMAVHFESGLKGIRENARLDVKQVAMAAQDAENKGIFGRVLDTLGKEAGLPGADVASLNAKAEAFTPLARQAGLSEAQVSKTLQDFKDNNWTQQATQRAMLARNDAGQLDQVAHDLTDAKGFYADKLDANKRNALLSQVLSRRQLLQDRTDHQQDRADAVGVRVIGQIDAQIASGVPATPEMWAAWADATKDTGSAQDFTGRVQDYATVQQVLRLPEAQQQQYLQQADAALQTNGGTVHEKQMLDRITTAVNTSIKQRNTDPLLWNQARLGDAVEPLDVSSLADKAQTGQLGQQLQQRAASIDAMQRQYGAAVPMKLLLPQEAQAVTSMLDKASPQQQAQLFGMMHQAVGDDTLYAAVMAQIAPAQPVLAYAGKVMGTGRSAITGVETHWFSPNVNVTMDPATIAQTMLDGQALIKPDEKGASKFPMPSDGGSSGLRAEWSTVVGDGFRGDGASDAQAYQAYRAMYAGLAAKAGKSDGVIDPDIAATAARATIGNVGDWNGKMVIPPYGMDFDAFTNKANTAWDARRSSVPGNEQNDLDAYDLDRIGDGVYVVSNGQAPVRDKDGAPVVIRVSPGIQSDAADKPKAEPVTFTRKITDPVTP